MTPKSDYLYIGVVHNPYPDMMGTNTAIVRRSAEFASVSVTSVDFEHTYIFLLV